MIRTIGNLGLLGVIAVLGACSDSGTGPNDPGAAAVSLSFSANPAAGIQPRVSGWGPGASVLVNAQLELTKVEIVLREIELKRVEVVDCDVEPEPEGCEEFETGPILVDLPLDGSTAQELSINVDPGTYDEVEFEIHKVSSDGPEDAAFRTTYPDFVDTSIRVQGMWEGQAFTYETDLDVEQEFDLMSPLIVDETTVSTNVTIRVDVSQWFVDASGAAVNPADANKGGQHESIVKENIKQSIEAFEDEDRDGEES
jgi:hypothetical protein